MNNLNLKLALISSLFVVSATASAIETGTTSFGVKATVVENCKFTKPSDLQFGDYDAVTSNSNVETSTDLTMTCTVGSTAKINLTGTKGSDTDYPFQMKNGESVLNYALYSNVEKTTPWNTTTAFEFTPSDAQSDTKTQTIYAVIKAGQNVPKGDYTDSVTVTVAF